MEIQKDPKVCLNAYDQTEVDNAEKIILLYYQISRIDTGWVVNSLRQEKHILFSWEKKMVVSRIEIIKNHQVFGST